MLAQLILVTMIDSPVYENKKYSSHAMNMLPEHIKAYPSLLGFKKKHTQMQNTSEFLLFYFSWAV